MRAMYTAMISFTIVRNTSLMGMNAGKREGTEGKQTAHG
jgi:hypothetical protein